METLLENTVIQLLGIIIGGLLAIASAYMTLFVAKATQRAKIETEKLNDERQKAIVDATLDKVDELLKTNQYFRFSSIQKEIFKTNFKFPFINSSLANKSPLLYLLIKK